VGKLKTRVGKGKKFFSALRAEFYQTNVCPSWPETMPAPLDPTKCREKLTPLLPRALQLTVGWATGNVSNLLSSYNELIFVLHGRVLLVRVCFV